MGWDLKPEMEVWVPRSAAEGGAFVKGTIDSINGDQVMVSGKPYELETVMPAELESNAPCEDNCGLMYLNEGTMLRNLERRFATDDIYTYTANILIALNPFAPQPKLYTAENVKAYFGKSLGVLPPHIYAIGDKSYRDMRNNNQSQCILCSGESGAGKTESTKHLLRYLTDTYGGGGDVADLEERILAANPMMESFGNAKTTRNNNSSRFGKFVEVHFNRNHKVIGAHILHYLLEKSRIIEQTDAERNYQVFYRMCRGAPKTMRDALNLQEDCGQYNYLKHSLLDKIEFLDDTKDFAVMEKSMTDCGLEPKEKSNVFRITASVLHIGNIDFEEAGDGSSIQAACESSLMGVSQMLGLDGDAMRKALCFKTVTAGGVSSSVGMSPKAAQQNRNGLAKSVYSKLFDWIVERVNKCFPFPQERSVNYIGVLDIAGFEYFRHNSFEQFCINYCNEKLQQFFNERTLRDEQELYIKEAINFNEVEFVDNHDVVDLIETPKTGILGILDEISKMPQASDKQFCEKLHKTYQKHFRLQLPRKSKMAGYSKMRDDEGFIIRHFAGAVGYESEGFLDKNNDALTADLAFLMDASADPFLVSIFKPKPGDPRPKRGKLTLISLGDKFKKALSVLMDKLNSCRASFVRCIKPNANQAPKEFNPPMILAQLQCAGMVSVLELMQGGFPSRTMFQDLYDMYKAILPPDLAQLDPRSFAKSLFKALGMNEADFQFGISRVFFRPGKFAEFDTIMRADPESLTELVAKVQIYLVKARIKKVAWATVASFKFDKKIKARGAAATIMQNVVKMYVYKNAYLHRIKGIKELKTITAEIEELRGTVAKLKKNQDQFYAKVNEVVNNLQIGINKIKTNPGITREEIKVMRDYLDKMIKEQLEALMEEQRKQKLAEEAERLRKLKEEAERKKREEEERKAREEQEKLAAEEAAKRRLNEESQARKDAEKMDKDMKETEASMAARMANMPKMTREQKQQAMMEKAELEQERRDQELAMQLAMQAGGLDMLTEDSQQAQRKIARRKFRKDGAPNLQKWEYAELKKTINETQDVELLEACKVEFQRRMKLYNEWKAKKAQQRNAAIHNAAARRSRAPAGPRGGGAGGLVPGDKSYYHGKIDREEAIRRIGVVNKNGAFLLRDGSQPGTYSISLQVDGNVNHIRIANKPNGTFAIGKSTDSYPTVFKCIEANAGAKLSNTMGQPNVKLAFPIPAPGSQRKAPIVAAAAARGAAPQLGGNKPKGPHRFYKVAFVPAGCTKKGWWYGHFVGDQLVRQLELSREKAPKLVRLGQSGLAPQRVTRDNEISGGEFDSEWAKYGGTPY
eukprot:m.100167 g.100167  ORF g.100167 m.100167 type:complete len:1317 (+) comp10335_c1_seq6:64-4014(+)